MWKIQISFLFLCICASAQTYFAPSHVNPIAYGTIPCPSNTDVNCPAGALHGTNFTFSDAGFPNSTFLRVTDITTPADTNPHPQFTVGCGGSAEINPISKLNTKLAVCATTQQLEVFALTWPTVTHLYGSTCILGGNSHCANNLWWSRVNDNLAYGDSLDAGASGSAHLGIYQYDFSSNVSYTKTLIKDLSTCPGASALGTLNTNVYIDDVSVSNDDQTFGLLASTGTGQDNASTVYAIIWNRSNGCRVWNTSTAFITGDYGTTGAITGTSDTFSMHNARIGTTGDWLKITWSNCFTGVCSSSNVANYLWQSNTATVKVNFQAPKGCGHQAIGSQYMANQCFGTGDYTKAIYDRPNNNPATSTLLPAVPPGETNVNTYDVHMSWPQGEPSDVYMTTKITYTSGFGSTPPATNAWDGEALAQKTDGTGLTYRLFHTYNSYKCTSCFYNVNVIGAPSFDGQYYLFTTDWNGMLGNADGVTTTCNITSTCRGDVFLVRLPLVTNCGH